ncbi:hypothetical protein FSARC_14414 [Fusarium sarcochroum]|uniref:Uncharacterized protein n=1 Tax=Fusarium sarcochroum TaxID=1208366 RepID=A0A8H4STN5_9HYPO|nr:hypothetical protein FSARC_14414 [Fusarium sarcochroum]
MGGLHTHHDVYPDLTTLGKYLGGGFGFDACGGREEIMANLNPGRLFHSGTYNNDTFTMAAGVAASQVLSAEKISKANALGDKLRDGINAVSARAKFPLLKSTGFGSCVSVHFNGTCTAQVKDTLFFYLLGNKIYIGKRGFLSVNLVHEEEHIDQAVRVFEKFFEDLGPLD